MATDMHRVGEREPKVTKALLWISKNASKYFEELTYENADNIITRRMD